MGYVSDAAAYLFSEFERLHVLESDLFVDDSHFEDRHKLMPDPAIKAEFDSHLAKADALADSALAKNPKDSDALFAKVLANGLRCDYAALIEKRNIASLGYMKTSRAQAQQLLAIDPTRYDAYLSLGAENYLLGANPAPVRWVLSLTGSKTDKQQGIEQLRIVAEKGHYLAPFARLLLAVAALRDKDTHTAKTLLAGLGHGISRQQAVFQRAVADPVARVEHRFSGANEARRSASGHDLGRAERTPLRIWASARAFQVGASSGGQSLRVPKARTTRVSNPIRFLA